MDRNEARRQANLKRINGELKKAAKAAKKRKWLDRKIKKHTKPKRTLKNYEPLDD